MRAYVARYCLDDGSRGVLHVIARHPFDVIDIALRTFADAGIARLSVRPA